MQQIALRGGNVHYTTEDRAVYRIVKGCVLVYIIPFNGDTEGRRFLLGEFEPGSMLPGFHHRSEVLGEWEFGFVAMDYAELIKEDATAADSLMMSFASAIGLKLPDAESFDSFVIERYERTSVKEKGYIYAAKREKQRTRESTLGMISDFFGIGNEVAVEEGFRETGRPLYDAAAFICAKEKIKIAPLSDITDVCGRRYDIHDIARISHFVIREIVLERDWEKEDTGSALAFSEEDDRPIACVPKGVRKHIAYDPKNSSVHPLDKEEAGKLKPNAFCFYRPFPEKKLGIMDIFRFGMEKVNAGDLWRLFGLALLGTLLGLLIPYLNEQIFDKLIPIGNSSALLQLGAVLLACSLGNISFTVVKNLAAFRSMNSMEYAVQSAAIDRLFSLPESFFRKYDAAELGQRVMGISMIYNVLAQSLISSLLTAVFSLLYLWRMFKYSTSMSLWSMLMLGAVMAFSMYIGIKQIKYEKLAREYDMDAQSVSFQNLMGISKIRDAWAEDRAVKRYFESFIESRKVYRIKGNMENLVETVTGTAPILFSMVFYYLMIRNSLGLTIGQFSAFTAAFGSFSAAMLTLVSNFLRVNMVKPLYEYSKPILETLPELEEAAAMPGKMEGDIEVNNVTFSYEPDEPPVLNGLNLHIKPGEYVGVVGSSGCGKSTLLKLLLGFEKPQLGMIYYDHRDLEEIDKRELRKKLGVVLQDGGLISGSIHDNIVITAPDTTMERVEETIKEVGLEKDIADMPMGLHTVVAEGAGTISGGQAQRILIARAIVGKPKVIFLDEATSALDNVTQNMVMETLEKIDATKLVIAHRLSTVKNCDRIIVMDKGTIVEQGTYEELMAMNGLFHDLAVRQIS